MVFWPKITPRGGETHNLNFAASTLETLYFWLAPSSSTGASGHGCRKCYTRPKTNRAFWDRKRETNIAHNRRVTRRLRGRGWKVIRIWQLPSAIYGCASGSQVRFQNKSPNACLNRIRRAVPSGI